MAKSRPASRESSKQSRPPSQSKLERQSSPIGSDAHPTVEENETGSAEPVTRQSTLDSEPHEKVIGDDDVFVSRHGYICYKYNGKRVEFHEHLNIAYPDGSKYSGSISQGECHGSGVFTLAGHCELPLADSTVEKECVFHGSWSANKQGNYGTHTCGDGHVYVGYWAQNNVPGDHMWRRQGEGRMTFPGGDSFEGVWENDMPLSGVWKYVDGTTHVGVWENYKRKGEGVTTYANGDRYEGQWKDDRRVDGKAKMYYKNGDYYVGDFQNEMRHGRGKIIYSNGDVFEGRWNNDRPAQGVKSYLRTKQLEEHINEQKRAAEEAERNKQHSRRPSEASTQDERPSTPMEIRLDRRHLLNHLNFRDGMHHLSFLTAAPTAVPKPEKTPRNPWLEGDDLKEANRGRKDRNKKQRAKPLDSMLSIQESNE